MTRAVFCASLFGRYRIHLSREEPNSELSNERAIR